MIKDNNKFFEGYIPTSLIQAIRENRCILFAGAGLSAPTFPLWQQLIEYLIDAVEKSGRKTEDLKSALQMGDYLKVTQRIKKRLGQNIYEDLLRAIFRPLPAPPIPRLHLEISDIPFSAIITTNFDQLFERAYRSHNIEPSVYTANHPDLGRVLERKEFFIFKLHGDIENPSSIVLSKMEYRDLVHNNRAFIELIHALLLNNTILFAGYSFRDYYFNWIRDSLHELFSGKLPPAYALLPDLDEEDIDELTNEENIIPIQYHREPNDIEHKQVLDFFSNLRIYGMPDSYYGVTHQATDLPTENYLQLLNKNLSEIQPLGRAQPLELTKLYVPLRLMEYSNPDISIDQHDKVAFRRNSMISRHGQYAVEDALLLSKKLVVLGQPGSGKSTLLRYLAVSFTQPTLSLKYKHIFRQLEGGYSRPLPIFIPLAEIPKNANILEFIIQTLAEYPINNLEQIFRSMLEQGNCIFLFDGLDEVGSSRSHKQIVEKINRFITSYDGNRFIITCRTSAYKTVFRGFSIIEITDFNWNDAKNFIYNWYSNKPMRANELISIFVANPRMQLLTTSPLLLSLVCLTFERSDWRLPEKKAGLYDLCIDVLLKLWDQYKEVAVERNRYFQVEVTRDLLEDIAFRAHNDKKRSFTRRYILDLSAAALAKRKMFRNLDERFLDEISINTGILRQRSRTYYDFAHLTFQEFLAASWINKNQAFESIRNGIGNPWWNEVLILLAGLLQDSSYLIETILEKGHGDAESVLLAGRCLGDANQVNVSLRKEIIERLLQLFNVNEWRAKVQDLLPLIPYPEVAEGLYEILFLNLSDRDITDEVSETIVRLRSQEASDLIERLLAVTSDQNVSGVRYSLIKAISEFPSEQTLPFVRRFLYDPDLELRRLCIKAIGQARDSESVESLIKILAEEKITSIKREIFETLGYIGDSKAVEYLLRSLKSNDPIVREGALVGLANSPSKTGARVILESIHSSDKNTRMRAIEAAGSRNEAEVLNALVRLITHRDVETVNATVRNLARWKTGETLPILINLLKTNNSSLVKAVAKGIALTNTPASHDALYKALFTPEIKKRTEISQVFGKYLGKLYFDRLINDVQSGDRIRQIQALRTLGYSRNPAAIYIVQKFLIVSNEEIASVAADALIEIGGKIVAKIFLEELQQTDRPRRLLAIRSITRMNFRSVPSDSIISQLSLIIEGDPSEPLKQEAVKALGSTGDLKAIPILRSTLKNSKHLLRREAAFSLIRIGGPEAATAIVLSLENGYINIDSIGKPLAGLLKDKNGPLVIDILGRLLQSKDFQLRERIAAIIAQSGIEEAIPYVKEVAKDEAPSMRRTIARNIRWKDADEDVQKILLLLLNDNDLQVRIASARSICNSLRTEPSTLIQLVLDLENDKNRSLIVSHMKNVNNSKTINLLKDHWSDFDSQLRIEIIQLLGRTHSNLGIPLVEVGLRDQDQRLRDAAAFALMAIRTPKAITLLRKVEIQTSLDSEAQSKINSFLQAIDRGSN
jgi:HEAT repeat protein